jgi:hypothetical protein
MEELTREHDCVSPSNALPPKDLRRWEDEDHIYLEAELDAGLGSSIDICIHAGRAFIRMTRP